MTVFIACDVCGQLINTDDDPDYKQQWLDGESCICCPACRDGDDDELRWRTETGHGGDLR